MLSKDHFIKATEEYNTFEQNVPAYYFRKSFTSDGTPLKISVAVCGFYEIWFNANRITRGFLSPYVSNPDHYVYYDEYYVTPDEGENVIGLMLGNGFQNNPGGHVWDFDKASFRSAPMVSLWVTKADDSEEIVLASDEDFKICPSPIRSDDYRFGEYYDANYEIEGWNAKGFDDSDWGHALSAKAPKGEFRIANVDPIVKEQELKPIDIFPCGDGYIYDFGQSNTGICRLKIQGVKGQKIELRHADSLKDGDLNLRQIWFARAWDRDKDIVHRDVYICKGEGIEEYQPTFTYHGFRYVRVDGITKEQATNDLLTYLIYHTDLTTRGDFSCSDPMGNTLQEITRRSIVSNFHHFPTDCPQREKNGWTADAALSSEAVLLNFDPERNYREWQRNICKAQAENGSLPGIIPTGGWGFAWGNGPAWDSVLACLPYYTYLYRGETEMITESAPSFVAYLRYLRTRCDEQGLLSIGLGDWCPVGGGDPKAPLILTDSIMAMDISNKIAEMFRAINRKEEETFARTEAEQYRRAIREHLIDFNTMLVAGECQSSQAMCLFYGVFEPAEEDSAFANLLNMVHAADDHMDVGVLGGRVIFHVLTRFGQGDLAYRMITREDYPSYGNWVKRGATTLWENFDPDRVASMNHHFWGDISAWFIKCLAGIRLNPEKHDVNAVEIHPTFIQALTHASAHHIAPAGKISSAWERQGEEILLHLEIPQAIRATAQLDCGFALEDGTDRKSVTSGTYKIIVKS